ncbi:MAG: hypothetical protein GX130_12340 [Candidatus Hydrogenedens sp.]|jgi:type II secretory pathway pseudopilin PulG|nr:hypothetical protein [Candidatus Hydrogenedens sp.]
MTVTSSKNALMKHLTRTRGFTLVEIMFAFGIFTLMMWSVAHSLVYSYAVLEIQEQRNAALAHCQTVLSTMRDVSYHTENSPDCTGGRPDFPCVLLNFGDGFPQSLDGANAAIRARYGSFFSLPEQEYQIDMVDDSGDPAKSSVVPNQNTNPVYVTVTTSWLGPRNHRYSVNTTAAITSH